MQNYPEFEFEEIIKALKMNQGIYSETEKQLKFQKEQQKIEKEENCVMKILVDFPDLDYNDVVDKLR